MSSSGGRISPHNSPCSSRSLIRLSKTFSGLKTAPVRKGSAFTKFGSVKGRAKKCRRDRKPSKVFRRRAIEVVDLSSDDDIEFLEEIIDICSDDECQVLKHIVRGKDEESTSEAGEGSGETNFPGSSSSGTDGGNLFSDLSLESISPFSFGSPRSSLRSMSPCGSIGSGEVNLSVSEASNDGRVEINSSGGIVAEITPLRPKEDGRDRIFQGETEVPSAMVCVDVVLVQGNQMVPTVQREQEGIHDGAELGDDVAGRGEPSDGQEVGSNEAEPDDIECSMDN